MPDLFLNFAWPLVSWDVVSLKSSEALRKIAITVFTCWTWNIFKRVYKSLGICLPSILSHGDPALPRTSIINLHVFTFITNSCVYKGHKGTTQHYKSVLKLRKLFAVKLLSNNSWSLILMSGRRPATRRESQLENLIY